MTREPKYNATGRSGIRFLAVLLAAGMVVRLLLVGWFHDKPLQIVDEQHYRAIAVNLVRDGQYAMTSGQLTSIRPPLYPTMVAGVYRLFGLENNTAVRLVQTGIGLTTVLLVYRLALGMYGPRVARWAAVVVCFYPSALVTESLVLTETLSTFFVVMFCLTVQRFLSNGAVAALIGMGALLGLAALTRSVFWLFPPFLVVFLFLALRKPEPSLRPESNPLLSLFRRGVLACVPVVVFGLVIAPWSVRNTRLHKTFTVVDVMGGRNFMMGNYEHTPMFRAWDAISVRGERAWDHVLAAEQPGFWSLTQGQKDKVAMRRGLRFVLEHPWLTARRDFIKFLNFWQLERTVAAGLFRGYWGDVPRAAAFGVAAITAGAYAAVILSGIFGFVMTRPADVRLHWFLLLLTGFVCAVHTAVFGHERYHLPLMPLAAIYAAAAWVDRREIWQRRSGGPFLLAAAISALLVVSWTFEALFVDLARFGTQVLSLQW